MLTLRLPFCLSLGQSCLLSLIVSLLTALPSRSAEVVTLRYGLLEASIPVNDLQDYANTQNVSPALQDILQFFSPENQVSFRQLLQKSLPTDRITLDLILNRPSGVQFLSDVGSTLDTGEAIGLHALRSAVILGTQPEGLSAIGFLKAYPLPNLAIDIPQALKVFARESPQPPIDNLSDRAWWQTLVAYQVSMSQKQTNPACLFGDSISEGIEAPLGTSSMNFAIGGMSSVSLIPQLQQLVTAHVVCQTVVIAIGTNDAWYTPKDDRFQQNLTEVIALTKQLQAKQIIFLPAFYSTLAASQKPEFAGPIDRVEQVNRLLLQVTKHEKITVRADVLQPLFSGQVLKSELTTDGVHLNAAGFALYRQTLLNLMPIEQR